MTRKVVIDTDPGLDDAIAILFALAAPQFNVLGLTTLGGNLGLARTTDNAGRLAALAGSAVPVVAGAGMPLVRAPIHEIGIHGDDGLGGVALPPPAAPAGTDAPSWMARHLAAAPPGKIDIFALGPLTNIALLVRDHPAEAARIGTIHVMGGAINEKGNVGPRSEFNLAYDPEAAAIVLGSGARIVLVPLDVTRKVRADAAFLEQLHGHPIGTIAADLIAAYFSDTRQSRPLHDACVPLVAARPDLFTLEDARIAIDTGDGPDAGAIRLAPDGAPVTIAMDVDAPAVLAHLASGLTR